MKWLVSARHCLQLFGLPVVLVACATTMSVQDERTFTSYIDLGVNYLRQGNVNAAQSALSRAQSINDSDYRMYHANALLAQFRGNNDKADMLFLKTLEQQPSFTRARNNYGVFLSTIDRDPEALEQLRLSAEDDTYPLRAISWENYAEVAIKIQRNQDAIDALQKAIQIENQPRFHRRLAHLYALDKQPQQALRYFQQFLQLMDASQRQPTVDDMRLGEAIADALNRPLLLERYQNRRQILEELAVE